MNFEEILRPAILSILDDNDDVIGTGFFITSDGYILTCYHVISSILRKDDSVRIRMSDGHIFDAIFDRGKSRTEIDIDFAILRAREIKNNFCLKVGIDFTDDDDWITLGFIFPKTYKEVANKGKIHSLVQRKNQQGFDIKLTAETPIRGGASGSPVFDCITGTVVGVITSEAGGTEVFAVPIKDVLERWPEMEGLNKSSINGTNEDSWELLKGELVNTRRDKNYESFGPFLERLEVYASKKSFDLEILKCILYIIKKLNKEYNTGNVYIFNEHFEQVSMGCIPPEWGIQKLIDQKFYSNLIDKITLLFEHNRDKLDLKLGRPLPIVVVVMNEKEANELATGKAFDGFPKKLCNLDLFEDFERLKKLMNQNGIENWESLYKNDIKLWRPFQKTEKTIEQLINEVIDKLERQELIIPIFIDIKTLNDPFHRRILRKLRGKACILVMDVISMQHPIIQCEFRKTLLDAFSSTLVARLVPIGDPLEFIDQMTVILEKHGDSEFFRRHHLDNDNKCITVSEASTFSNWLKSQFEDKGIQDEFFKGR